MSNARETAGTLAFLLLLAGGVGGAAWLMRSGFSPAAAVAIVIPSGYVVIALLER